MIALLLAGCASTPRSPQGAADARAKLTRLQSDTNLARHAPIEIREAEAAVRLAETPVPKDQALGTHRVYLADHKVEIAEAKASTRYAEDQRALLIKQSDQARLDARTREADMARLQADLARSDANRARSEADAARADAANASADAERRAELARIEATRDRDAAAADAARRAELASNEATRARNAAAADAARQAELARNEADRKLASATADAARESAELQRQIDLLQAETTDRGLVLTLGNVLFETGRADLKLNATESLNRLVSFLNQYQDRNVVIEGHTDNVGTDTSNQILSQHRAESVRSYLLQQGIGSQRLAASGMGESKPIADNDTASGRQQNRRVEVIIDQPALITAVSPTSQ
jgi:outer membrane protein OmpA-like peptidoglycan-associated protein